jgi:SAM-dependent MidA family methyltransferase
MGKRDVWENCYYSTYGRKSIAKEEDFIDKSEVDKWFDD